MATSGRILFAVLAAGVLLPAAPVEQAPQTIELPSIDRSRIAFRLDAEPSVVIGPARVPGGFFRVPNRVARLSDGRIVLATAWGFSRLHVVDPAGNVATIGNFNGRMGSLESVCRTTDDRLLVFHDRTQFTSFSPSGAIESTGTRPTGVTLLCPPDESRVWVRAQLPGSVGPPSETPHDPSITSGRYKIALRRIDLGANSRVVADLGEFESTDFYPVGPVPPVQGWNRPPLYSWRPRPFTREFAMAVDAGRLHGGDGTTWEVRTWDAAGRLVRILRVRGPLEPVTPDLRAAFIEQEFAGNTAAFRERTIGQARLQDASIYPSALPAYSELRVDRSGRLWVRRYPRPLEATQEWWVFTAEAQYVGRVDLPAAFGIEDIGDDHIAGSYLLRKAARPESDVIMDRSEYDVRVYRLRRG
jgi:hypothetical protein